MLPCQGRCRRFESGPPLTASGTTQYTKTYPILFIVAIVVLAILFLARDNGSTKILTDTGKKQTEKKANKSMKIVTSAFQNNSTIPAKYTCDGKNINPSLEFIDVPNNAKSLALIVDDPDASSKIWVHWVVYNINPKATKVDENSIPQGGIEGMTDFGNKGYGGPCPHSGIHHYFFKLYALNTMINLPEEPSKEQLEKAMQGHILDKAELIGLYSR